MFSSFALLLAILLVGWMLSNLRLAWCGFSVVVLLLASVPGRAESSLEKLRSLENVAAPSLVLPPMVRTRLNNGMRLFFLRQVDYPVVQGVLYWPGGQIYDPENRVGLAQLTAALLRVGGTQSHSPEAFNEALASLGAEIQSSADRDYGVVSFRCLQEDFPRVLTLLAEMLRDPRWDQAQFDLLKQQSIEAVRREQDDPGALALREFPGLVYGSESPWGRRPTVASLQAIQLEDVRRYYEQYYRPSRMILGLSADLSTEQLTKVLENRLGSWNLPDEPLPPLSPLEKNWTGGVFLLEKNTDQSTLILGHWGEKRNNPDKYALMLLNEILGGEVMSSRLGKRIRSTLGLSYGIYSQFGFQSDYGLFFIFGQTKGVSTLRVLKEARQILKNLVAGSDLSQAELDQQKRSLLNSLFAQYEPLFNYVKEEARFALYGYPPDYLKVFEQGIRKVTLEDLRRVAKLYLRPDALQVLVVGNSRLIGALPGAKLISVEEASPSSP